MPLQLAPLHTIGTPGLWAVTIGAVLVLLVLDFVVTRKPHTVSMREAIGWSVFYIALPLAFALVVTWQWGSQVGLEYLTGYLVEKSLSIDNLFVFMLLLSAFAVPEQLRQRALLYGIVGALVLRGAFIAIGAAALQALDWAFLLFGAVLLVTAVKIIRDEIKGPEEVDVGNMRSVRLLRRVMPVTTEYHGPRLTTPISGRRSLTPFALVVVALFATDIVFAIDSIPAVYGITGDPYLVFATNAFALLGLRQLYFLIGGLLERLVYLSYGLAVVLGFIGAKLVLEALHTNDLPFVNGGEPVAWAPEIPIWLSLTVILGTLAVVTVASLVATHGDRAADRSASGADGAEGAPDAVTARADRPAELDEVSPGRD